MRCAKFGLVVLLLAAPACGGVAPEESGSNPAGPSNDSGTRPPQTGLLAFSTTASRGWTSIDVYVDGSYVGTLRSYYTSQASASCAADGNARVVATLNVGQHAYSARTNTGATWTGDHNVTSGSCMEITLTCNGGDCSR